MTKVKKGGASGPDHEQDDDRFRIFERFTTSGCTFTQRDRPSTLCSAVGRLALAYADLQNEIDSRIKALLGEERMTSPPDLRDLSFRRRVDMLHGLIEGASKRTRFNVGDLNADRLVLELTTLLRSADELYHSHMDPSLLKVHLRYKASPALSAHIMDVADYCMYAQTLIEEFFLEQTSIM